MLVAIERNKFTYLYKYNQIRVDINQILDKPIDDLKAMIEFDIEKLVVKFNKILPLFEQEHEIILLDIDKNKIELQNEIVLTFDSIFSIYPLTKIGSQLLEGKINEDFKVNYPIFEKVVEILRVIRTMEVRAATSSKLLSIFSLEGIISKQHFLLIELSVRKSLLDKTQPQNLNSFLDHLISYNKTPSFIPEGNIENICKIGAIAIQYLGKSEEVFTNGPFYKLCIKYKSQINSRSYDKSFHTFLAIDDHDFRSSCEKMVDIISKDYNGIDIFKASYFFLAFKSFLNKNDNDLLGIIDEFEKLISRDRYVAAFVISLIGYCFSFENIYESIHKLSVAPLLKSSLKRNDQIQIALDEPNIQVKEAQPVSNEVSEAVVIYEDTGATMSKGEINSEAVLTKTGEAINHLNDEGNDSIESIFENKRNELTIESFKIYLGEKYPKSKQKKFIQVLNYLYPNKNSKFSYEDLIEKLDQEPELKEKFMKSKNEKEIIRTFFISLKS